MGQGGILFVDFLALGSSHLPPASWGCSSPKKASPALTLCFYGKLESEGSQKNIFLTAKAAAALVVRVVLSRSSSTEDGHVVVILGKFILSHIFWNIRRSPWLGYILA